MARKASTKGNGDSSSSKTVKFHYLKGTHFRTIHADGTIGSITPQGYIHMSIYNERPAIPREMVQELNDNGSLGPVIPSETIVREGYVREMEVDVMMNIEIAKSIRSWLDDRIKEIEQQTAVVNKSRGGK